MVRRLPITLVKQTPQHNNHQLNHLINTDALSSLGHIHQRDMARPRLMLGSNNLFPSKNNRQLKSWKTLWLLNTNHVLPAIDQILRPFCQIGVLPVRFWVRLPQKIKFVCWLPSSMSKTDLVCPKTMWDLSIGMGNCVLFMNSPNNIQDTFGTAVEDCYWLDVSGLHVFFNFQCRFLGTFSKFWCGFSVNGQLHTFCYVHTSSHIVGSLVFFAFFNFLLYFLGLGGHDLELCTFVFTAMDNFTLEVLKLPFLTENKLELANFDNYGQINGHILNLRWNFGYSKTTFLNLLFYQFGLQNLTMRLYWVMNNLFNKHCDLCTIGPGYHRIWRNGVLANNGLDQFLQPLRVMLDKNWFDVIENELVDNTAKYFVTGLTTIYAFSKCCISWVLTPEWNLRLQNSFDLTKRTWTSFSCCTDWAEIWLNLGGQELSNNWSWYCVFATLTCHQPILLWDCLFFLTRWKPVSNHGLKASFFTIK